jgi:hypothetical protein
VAVAKSDASACYGLTDGHGTEAKRLADDGEGLAGGIALDGLLNELRGELLAGAQRDLMSAQLPGDGVPVGTELTGQLVCREAVAVQLKHSLQLFGAELAGHPVFPGVRVADLR